MKSNNLKLSQYFKYSVYNMITYVVKICTVFQILSSEVYYCTKLMYTHYKYILYFCHTSLKLFLRQFLNLFFFQGNTLVTHN